MEGDFTGSIARRPIEAVSAELSAFPVRKIDQLAPTSLAILRVATTLLK
jgi:hypothetical protein